MCVCVCMCVNGDGQDGAEAAHDKALQPMDLRLQEHCTLEAVEEGWYDLRGEDPELGPDLDPLLQPQPPSE